MSFSFINFETTKFIALHPQQSAEKTIKLPYILEEQLVTDLMALIASFSGKLYQLRVLQAKGYDREEKEREKIDGIKS
ncbi:MAG: hypothetical protein K9W44_13200 [Candidatus Lokiarchaeota archaeon]|nr:hypothetical protein [Candidatus Harpocratesius repetitus]